MTTLSLTLPEVGKPDKSEDPKINTAFTTIQTWGNGNIEAANLAAATAKEAGLNRGSETVKGALITSTEQETTSATFTTLLTPDEVTVTLPNEGLLIIGFQATWQQSAASAARAAIFIGANQLKLAPLAETAPAVQEAKIGATTAKWTPLATGTAGLESGKGEAEYGGDVTTGQILGTTAAAGLLAVFATTGTYAISVKFKTSSGSLKVKGRRLYVEAKSF